MKHPKIALLTCEKYPGLPSEESFLPDVFRAAGISAIPVIWNQPSMDWSQFDGILIRTPWDYVQRIDLWIEWLDRMEMAKVKLWNPPDLVRWNLNKKYLIEMGRAGLPVVPTFAYDSLEIDFEKFRTECADAGFSDRFVIIKDAVSAGGLQVKKLEFEKASQIEASLMPRLVQPFLPSVQDEGEFSLVFIEGDFSHGARKVPAREGFLVHPEFGGSMQPWEPEPEALSAALEILNWTKARFNTPLYARFDLLRHRGKYLLGELEVFEPSLYFGIGGMKAAQSLVGAIRSRLSFQPE